MKSRLIVSLALVLCAMSLACRPGARPGDFPGSQALDGTRRLGRGVVPLRYALDLAIDPATERFTGRAAIDVKLIHRSRVIQLHGGGLEITRATIERDGHRRSARTAAGAGGALVLGVDEPLEKGRVTLHFEWSGPLAETPNGLYRVEVDDRWYAFTQFEPLEARKTFPCFDQPEFKTPYAVTLRVPAGQRALSSGPLLERRREGETDVHRFGETFPLPSYLVAFAVGDFDVVPESGVGEPPLRLVSARGRGGAGGELTAYALARTPRYLAWLSDYFAHPFPFAKLDLVAVPNFSAGAMENVGLVTFREKFLLLDGEKAPPWDRRWSQTIIAHELAHMWYGNLVTMAWWDDLWLNESFATWMATRAVGDIDPELEVELDAVAHTQYIMHLDSKRDARRIRQPIRNGGDIYNAFDGITYGKGAAVLRMIESWIGAEAFRDGVRAYMRAHAYGTGGTAELLGALARASGSPVAATAARFLDQPGTPLIEVRLECGAGEGGASQLVLEQTRYLPLGSDAPVGKPWTVPVCIGYGPSSGGDGRGRQCFVLDGPSAQVGLDRAAGCPAWLHPNDGERGYYRWSVPEAALLDLAGRHRSALTVAERVALPGHTGALLEAGAVDVATHASALALLSGDPHRKVVEGVAGALRSLADKVVTADMADAYAIYVRELLAPSLDRVGLEPRSGESVDAQLLRRALTGVLADAGRTASIRSHARDVVERFLADPKSVSQENLGLFLPVAAWQGDEELWTRLVAVVNEVEPLARSTTVRALGSFEDPGLVRRSLDLIVDGRLRAQDYRTLAGSIRREMRPVGWHWLTEHFDEVAGLVGPMSADSLPWMAAGLCSEPSRAEVEAYFDALESAPQGTERNVQLVLEEIERCARLRAAVQEPLRDYLAATAWR